MWLLARVAPARPDGQGTPDHGEEEKRARSTGDHGTAPKKCVSTLTVCTPSTRECQRRRVTGRPRVRNGVGPEPAEGFSPRAVRTGWSAGSSASRPRVCRPFRATNLFPPPSLRRRPPAAPVALREDGRSRIPDPSRRGTAPPGSMIIRTGTPAGGMAASSRVRLCGTADQRGAPALFKIPKGSHTA